MFILHLKTSFEMLTVLIFPRDLVHITLLFTWTAGCTWSAALMVSLLSIHAIATILQTLGGSKCAGCIQGRNYTLERSARTRIFWLICWRFVLYSL